MTDHFTKRNNNATGRDELGGPSPVSTRVAVQHNQDEVSHLYSTSATATSVDSILSQITDSSTLSSQIASTSSEARTHAIKSSVDPAPPKASHQGHVGNVGTVVSEADVPKEWGPKFLDVEKAQADRFMGYMVLIFAVTMVGIIGIGWWK
jgi:hypothetical protein